MFDELDTAERKETVMATERERTAYHEAGHFVAGLQAVDVQASISIVPDDEAGTWGHVIGEVCERYVDERMNPGREKVIASVVSLYAGFAAQRLLDPQQPEAEALAGATADFAAAGIWADVLGRAEGIQRAQEFVAEHWNEIEVLAKALLVKETLDAEQADAIVLLASEEETVIARSAGNLVHLYGWTAAELSELTGIRFTKPEPEGRA